MVPDTIGDDDKEMSLFEETRMKWKGKDELPNMGKVFPIVEPNLKQLHELGRKF